MADPGRAWDHLRLTGGMVTRGWSGVGGSILAVPLLVYFVGVSEPHIAISAIAVAVTAAINLAHHAHARTVKWQCASVFAAAGLAGAVLGSSAGKMADGQILLILFAVLMLVVAALMVQRRTSEGKASVRLNRENLPSLVGLGAVTVATGMPIFYAVGSSLLAVTVFGIATAANYAASGLVDWTLAVLFIAGGALGGFLGAQSAKLLSGRKGALNVAFAVLISALSIYIFTRGVTAFVT